MGLRGLLALRAQGRSSRWATLRCTSIESTPANSAGERPIRYAAELVTSSIATFELFAELSIALAGFTGVAAAFGGRDREFSGIDRGRLDAVFLFSGASLAVSLLAITLVDAGVSTPRTFRTCCAVAGGLILGIFARQLPRVIRLRRDGEASTSRAFIAFAFLYLLGLPVAYFWAAIAEPTSWPLFAGISSQLLYGLWMFARLLVLSR